MNSNSEKVVFENLVKGNFPKNFISKVYPSTPQQKIYVIAMDQVREPNREYDSTNPDAKAYFRHDAIFAFLPGKEERKNSAFDYHQWKVSIEIKNSKSDLRKDTKIPQYLGAVHYCFLAVPKALLSDGFAKIKSFGDCANFIGLINSDNGDIVIMPASQDEILNMDRQGRLLTNMFGSPKRYDEPEDVYLAHLYMTGAKSDKFVEWEDTLLNEKYDSLIH